MFTKKKSLAKIAKSRKKKERSEDVTEAVELRDPSEEEGSSSEEDVDFRNERNLLAPPLTRENSLSTPNLSTSVPRRNHSLKYSSGALHGEEPCDFDHTYTGPSSSSMRKMVLTRRAHPDRRRHGEHPSTPRRTQSQRNRHPPRTVSAGTSPIRMDVSPSTRAASYSPLDRKEEDDDSVEQAFLNSRLSPPEEPEEVIKSKSMTSLISPADPLTQSLNLQTVAAASARTRSYLLGSVGATSLLGPQELERCFPDRTLRLFVGTWNMNGKLPPRHLAEFLLPHNLDFVPDILVVGVQESFPERVEWEVRLQDTLGPSHVLFHSTSMGTLHQAIFLRRDLIWYCSVPETDSVNVRPGTQFRTKGAVATAFMLFGTSFLLVNSHLTSHQENTKDRIKDFKKINAMLDLPRELPSRGARHRDISEKFDCIIWAGDLNFRLEQTREVVIREVRDGVAAVLDFDQLNFLRREGLIFKGYRESPVKFPPTYKYDVGSNSFDSSTKQRTPSYTDRILFKCHKSTEMSCLCYDSVQDVTTSDHKPVWGMWEIKIRPGRDSIPLAGGLFNRDVYVDGLKRRAEALQPVLGNRGPMCVVQ